MCEYVSRGVCEYSVVKHFRELRVRTTSADEGGGRPGCAGHKPRVSVGYVVVSHKNTMISLSIGKKEKNHPEVLTFSNYLIL